MIYLIRHGETDLNKQKVLQGRSNFPLNEAGRKQAEQVRMSFERAGIRIDRVYSSPLTRAVQTAQIITGENTELITDERLLEMDYGPYEGSGLENPSPEIIYFFSDFINHPAPEGMESLASVVDRLGDFIRSLPKDFEGNILISTHAIAMKGALEYLSPESNGSYWPKHIGNCAVYQTEAVDGGFTVPTECSFTEGKQA